MTDEFDNRMASRRSGRIISSWPRRRGGLLALGAVLGAGLLALGDALAVEHAADDVVADARQVADAAAPHQDDRVLLEVVPLAADVGGDFLAVGEPDSRHLAQGRVGLLGRHRLDLEAHAPLERGCFQHRRLGLVLDRSARLADKLVDRGHRSVVPFPSLYLIDRGRRGRARAAVRPVRRRPHSSRRHDARTARRSVSAGRFPGPARRRRDRPGDKNPRIPQPTGLSSSWPRSECAMRRPNRVVPASSAAAVVGPAGGSGPRARQPGRCTGPARRSRARRPAYPRPRGRPRPPSPGRAVPSSVKAQAVATAVTASHRCGRVRLWNAREPSSCQIGVRLKRLIQAPTRARAPQSGYSVSRYTPAQARAAAAAPDRPGQADAGVFAAD